MTPEGRSTSIPNYQTFMAPALRALHDGQPRPIGPIRDLVAAELGITDAQRAEQIPGGRAGVFDSRVGWAVTYMVQAWLIQRPRRAINQITQRGLDVLRDHSDRVDVHVLEQFEEFRDFRARSARTPNASEERPRNISDSRQRSAGEQSPRGTISAAVEENTAAVASDLLSRIRQQEPMFLEDLFLKVLTAHRRPQ